MIRQLFVVLMLLGGGNLIVPALGEPQNSDLTGLYKCEGVSPDGKPYQAIVEIAKIDHTYRVRWILSPEDSYLGLGIVKGDSLAVSYFGRTAGVILYKIEEGPRLVGEWTSVRSEGSVFPETLTRTTAEEAQPPQPQKSEPQKPTTPPARFQTVALALGF